MQAVVELQALPLSQQRALRAADRGKGLSRWLGVWVVTQYVPLEVGNHYAREDVIALQKLGLLSDGYPARATDAGIELLNCGHVARDIRA